MSEEAPLSLRDTLPAPPSAPAMDSGARRIPSGGVARRDTAVGLAPLSAPPPSTPPASAPPISSPPVSAVGRYSAQALHDDVVLTPPPPASKRAAKETMRRSDRNVIRVDEVGATTIVARQEASAATKPRVVTRTRKAASGLDAHDAALLRLLDRPRTVPELAHDSPLAEHELMKAIARLVRLGLVTTS